MAKKPNTQPKPKDPKMDQELKPVAADVVLTPVAGPTEVQAVVTQEQTDVLADIEVKDDGFVQIPEPKPTAPVTTKEVAPSIAPLPMLLPPLLPLDGTKPKEKSKFEALLEDYKDFYDKGVFTADAQAKFTAKFIKIVEHVIGVPSHQQFEQFYQFLRKHRATMLDSTIVFRALHTYPKETRTKLELFYGTLTRIINAEINKTSINLNYDAMRATIRSEEFVSWASTKVK